MMILFFLVLENKKPVEKNTKRKKSTDQKQIKKINFSKPDPKKIH